MRRPRTFPIGRRYRTRSGEIVRVKKRLPFTASDGGKITPGHFLYCAGPGGVRFAVHADGYYLPDLGKKRRERLHGHDLIAEAAR
jgi:hypothetical protein